jgi:hypothetical protein
MKSNKFNLKNELTEDQLEAKKSDLLHKLKRAKQDNSLLRLVLNEYRCFLHKYEAKINEGQTGKISSIELNLKLDTFDSLRFAYQGMYLDIFALKIK